MRRLIWLLVVLVVVFKTPALASEPVRIGFTESASGKYSRISGYQVKAYKMWVQEVNQRGGLLGRQVRLVIYDDRSDPARARRLYEKLAIVDRVDILFAPYSSTLTEAVLPVTERYAHPVLVAGASSDELWQNGYKNVFGMFTPASRFAVGFMEVAFTAGIEKIAVIYPELTFPENCARGAAKWARRFGLEVVMSSTFQRDAAGARGAVDSARAAGAEALLLCGYYDEAVNVRRAMNEAGWEPRAYFATVGPALQAYGEKLGALAEGSFSSSLWEYPGSGFPGSRGFSERFEAMYGIRPVYQGASAFAAGQVLEAAVKKVGTFDRAKLSEALSGMDMMTIIGRYGVDRTGMQVRHFNLLLQWQGGRKVVVWPREVRAAEPVIN